MEKNEGRGRRRVTRERLMEVKRGWKSEINAAGHAAVRAARVTLHPAKLALSIRRAGSGTRATRLSQRSRLADPRRV